MTDNTQPEALRLAELLTADEWPGNMTLVSYARECVAELRRQHARIAELEAQLEAIGAGGVSGPLMGCADSKEREALTAYLKDCDENAIVPDVGGAWHAAFEAGRASLAASAGSEPVAGLNEYGVRGYLAATLKCWHRLTGDEAAELVAMTQRLAGLYLHPSPPEGMVGGWIALPGTLPKPGTPVLLDIGKKYPIRAMWAAKHTVPAAGDDTDWGEYDEATDQYWCPEGWYEWNEHEDTNWAVSATPRAWATLPPTTPAGSGKGESNADQA